MNRKIVDYMIVSDTDVVQMYNSVTDYLNEDWHIYGNPYSSVKDHCQAMVRYEKEV